MRNLREAKIYCHHYAVSEDDEIVMMTWNSCMRKFNKRWFLLFYTFIWCHRYTSITTTVESNEEWHDSTVEASVVLLQNHLHDIYTKTKQSPFWQRYVKLVNRRGGMLQLAATALGPLKDDYDTVLAQPLSLRYTLYVFGGHHESACLHISCSICFCFAIIMTPSFMTPLW